MNKLFSVVFTVQGIGAFPIDMLRREECFPNSSFDSAYITATDDLSGDKYTIQLKTVVGSRGWKPNAKRWESFGWKVLRTEEQER